jgi:hypothetical protein
MGAGVAGAEGALARFARSAVATAGTVTALAAVMAQATRSFATQAGELKKWETRLGASASELSKMQYAARITNVEFSALTVGMQRLQRRVADAADGNKMLAQTLQRLGLDANVLARQRIDETFTQVATAIGKLDDESKKTLMTFRLFDVEGVALKQLFDELPGLMKKAETGYRSMSDDMIERGERVRRLWEDIKAAAGGAALVATDYLTRSPTPPTPQMGGAGTGFAASNYLGGLAGQLGGVGGLGGGIGSGLALQNQLGPTVPLTYHRGLVGPSDFSAGPVANLEPIMETFRAVDEGASEAQSSVAQLIRESETWRDRIGLLATDLNTSLTNQSDVLLNNLRLSARRTLDNLADAFGQSIAFGQDWKAALTNVIKSFVAEAIAELIKLQAKMIALGLLKAVLSFIPGGNVASVASGALTQAAASGGIPTRAAPARQETVVINSFGGRGAGAAAARAWAAVMAEGADW